MIVGRIGNHHPHVGARISPVVNLLCLLEKHQLEVIYEWLAKPLAQTSFWALPMHLQDGRTQARVECRCRQKANSREGAQIRGWGVLMWSG
jgi:hypothetical protein